MKVEVVGKNGFNPSQANRDYVEKKLSKLEDVFGESPELKAYVTCKVYKEFHKVEVTVPTKNLIMRAEVQEQDLYAAIDKAIDKLLAQVRKHKTRVKSKLDKEGIQALNALNLEPEEAPAKPVRNKEVTLEPMTQEEAIEQMELLGHDFYVYLDKNTHKTNVVYVRNDGQYAVIETK